MKNKAYIINFDYNVAPDNFDYVKFHNILTTAKGVIDWWHHLKSSYIIITPESTSATNVTEFMRVYMPNRHFFVSELNLQNHNGWLPKEAWEWINKYK